jgi:hypothetical protein
MVGIVLVMTLGVMRIGPFDLYEAFTADGLVTAARVIQVRWVGEETDRAFGGVFVKEDLDGLAVDERIVG